MSEPQFDRVKLIRAAQDLQAYTETTFAVFLDAERGWLDQEKLLLTAKTANITKLGFSEVQALGVTMSYAIRRKDGSETVLHESTVAETIGRIGRKGTNHMFLANMCVASLYAFWETQARAQLADAYFGKYDIVTSDLFGDLRLIRHCILHCRGIADVTMEKCKMIRWFKEGERIEFNAARLHAIVTSIRKLTHALEEVADDPSPGVKADSIFFGAMDADGNYLDLPPEGTQMGSPLRDPSSPNDFPKICPLL